MSTTTQTQSVNTRFVTPGNPKVLGRMRERRQAGDRPPGRKLVEAGYHPAQPSIGFMKQCKEPSNMPSYPGLERWRLLEKLADGAFSSVYRASDTKHEHSDVAVKVLRKYEMNDRQVCEITCWAPALGACLWHYTNRCRKTTYAKKSTSHEN